MRAIQRQRRWWAGWGVAFGATAVLVVLATLPPFLPPDVRVLFMRLFSGLCHQIPERSPHLDGIALAVCHRCYGIYWGLPLAALAFLGLRRWDGRISRAGRFLIPASLVPPGADWLGDVLGLWVNTPLSRVVTGGVFGLVAGYFLARALVELFLKEKAASPEAAGVEAS